jgi:hypothetical protein
MAGPSCEQALDLCEEEIYGIDEAIEALREVREMDDVIADLEYRRNALCEEADGNRREIEKENEIDEQLLRREWERDLL